MGLGYMGLLVVYLVLRWVKLGARLVKLPRLIELGLRLVELRSYL